VEGRRAIPDTSLSFDVLTRDPFVKVYYRIFNPCHQAKAMGLLHRYRRVRTFIIVFQECILASLTYVDEFNASA